MNRDNTLTLGGTVEKSQDRLKFFISNLSSDDVEFKATCFVHD